MSHQQNGLGRSPINPSPAIIPGLCAGCSARNIGLCDALDDQDLHFLASVATSHIMQKGQIFIAEGDQAQHFFNINQGTAKLFKDLPDGRRQITGFVHAGDFVGLAAANQYGFSAEAINAVQLCRFDRTEIRSVFSAFPTLERRLLDIASHELVLAQEQMLLLGRKTAIERLASFLWTLSKRTAINPSEAEPLDLPMTRGEISDYLGLTIETVSRALTRLRQQNIIDDQARHAVRIINYSRLSALANSRSWPR